MDPRDDRLRHGQQLLHHAVAVTEQLLLPGRVGGMGIHLLQVMAGAKAAAVPGYDDDACTVVCRQFVEGTRERGNHP